MMPEEAGDYTSSCSDDEERVLREFLEMPLEGTDAVFRKFLDLDMPGTIHEKGKCDFQEFLYIPGSRKDRVVLVAHADTYWDSRWAKLENTKYRTQKKLTSSMRNGRLVFRNEYGTEHNRNGGLGADDRAGCAMLYLLRDMGHSILVTEGEEHRGKYQLALFPSRPELLGRINKEHQFAIQLDRENNRDFKCYDVGTDQFKEFIAKNTGYKGINDAGRTDIVALCETICGVNFSIGYYSKHHSDEYLDFAEWKDSLEMVRKLLRKDLPRFER